MQSKSDNAFMNQFFSTLPFLRSSPRKSFVQKSKKCDVLLGDWWDYNSSSCSISNVTTTTNAHENNNATEAFESRQIRSIDDWANAKVSSPPQTPLRVKFVNQSPHVLVLCWASTSGALHHYYYIEPHGCHEEKTFTGDAFVLFSLPPNTDGAEQLTGVRGSKAPKRTTATVLDTEHQPKLNAQTVIAAYRPMNVDSTTTDDDDESYIQHRVVIQPHYTKGKLGSSFRGSSENRSQLKNCLQWSLHVKEHTIKLTGPLIDTRKKVYELEMFGPWKVQCEPGCWDIELEPEKDQTPTKSGSIERRDTLCAKELFKSDLMAITRRLPKHARELLYNSTTFWINKSFRHGHVSDPVVETGACFHPEKEWLQSRRFYSRKLHGVEFYDSSRWYHEDRRLWGPGGVILHELSHAWHCLHVPDGFDNKEIIECYNSAMKNKLYDCVPYHTLEKKGYSEARAYACTNACEYFAELSVAFLSNVYEDDCDPCDEKSANAIRRGKSVDMDETKDIEFNKWFPFNKKQLEEFDPKAFRCLQRMWGVKS